MVEIISFRSRQQVKKESLTEEDDSPLIWTCTDCDGQIFHLYESGEVYCASCDNLIEDLRTFDPEE